MSAEKPNRFRDRCGEHGSHGNFGNHCTVNPMHITAGRGHQPHLAVTFEGCFELDMTPAALMNFIREGQAALAKLPLNFTEISDYVGGEQ